MYDSLVTYIEKDMVLFTMKATVEQKEVNNSKGRKFVSVVNILSHNRVI